MPKYRKKPVVIEARLYEGGAESATPIIDWILAEGGTARYHHEPVQEITIDTLEGTMAVSRGDYVIRGVQGEFYPCKPDIFRATYEFAAE